MRISVSAGHSRAYPGASGILDEVTEARAVKDALIAELRARGHTVVDCTGTDRKGTKPLPSEIAKVNAANVELAVSLHFNAGGGTGSEVFHDARSSRSRKWAQRLAPALAASMGIGNRGAKPDTAAGVGSLGFCRQTNCAAVLCEVAFVDSSGDAAAYRKAGASGVAAALADAIVGGGSKPVAPPSGGSSGGSLDLGDKSWWGPKYTREMQSQLGTEVDGVVSRQPNSNKRYLPRADTSSWRFGSTLRLPNGFAGSLMVQRLQAKVGATVDGWMGKETVRAMQKWLVAHGYSVGSCGADGSMGADTCRAVGAALEAGAFK